MRGRVVEALVIGALLAACSTNMHAKNPHPTSTPSTETSTYPVVEQSLRRGEVAVHASPVRDGNMILQVIGLTEGISVITGTHAEWRPKGVYLRVRVLAQDDGLDATFFMSRMQQLVDSEGRTYLPESNAMRIKRQPDEAPLGPYNRIELDLWYDIPVGATAQAMRLFGHPASSSGQLVQLR